MEVGPSFSTSIPELESEFAIESGLAADRFAPPRLAGDELPQESLDLTLDEALSIAFQNTTILRGLGAQVLRNPNSAPGALDPSIQETDPDFGVAGALSQFDALFSASLGYQKNDNVFNNAILGGGANEVQQDLVTSNMAINKFRANGTQFALRGNVDHDANNQPGNLFDHVWNTTLEAEARKPLLQGRGVMFNQIAGPNGRPGLRNSSGVVISRINNDISDAEFERGVRDFVDEVINAYWQLYFAYRNYETAQKARDGALETWDIVKAKFENELPGGEADKESEARELYYVFQAQLLASLNGDPRSGTVGVLQAESELRRLLDMPQSDDRMIRPNQEPMVAKVIYDWDSVSLDALQLRAELRQQKWRIKQRELQLFASRNFLLPRLDAVATLRNNGFGDDLAGGGQGRFASALKDAASRDHNELEFGLQYSVPVGRRQAIAGARNAELLLARERAVLVEQEKQVLQDLGSAIRQASQSYQAAEFARKRMEAAQTTVDSRTAAFEADAVPFDLLLDAQRRLAEAESAYFRELVNFELATQAIKRESGQLLNEHFVSFSGEINDERNAQLEDVESAVRSAQQKSIDMRSYVLY